MADIFPIKYGSRDGQDLLENSVTVATKPVLADGVTATPQGVAWGKLWDWGGLSYNVVAAGAKGDGVTDDTTAITLAHTTAAGTAKVTYAPQRTYVYNGPGLTGTSFIHDGGSYGAVVITLGAASWFIKTPSAITVLDLQGLKFSGGLGVILNTFAGVNVAQQMVVDRVWALNYTQCMWGSLASDQPYKKLTRSILFGTATSFGVAWAGASDQSAITDTDFLLNKVHIKLAQGGNNVALRNLDLIQFAGGASRVAIWIVPHTAAANAGTGFVADSCKFGNENQDTTDYRFLFADETAGGDFSTNQPNVAADSTGYVTGHLVHHCMIFGAAGIGPFIYATTPNIRDCDWSHLGFAGSNPTYFIQTRTVVTRDRENTNNLIGPLSGPISNDTIPFPISNTPGIAFLQDPQGWLSANSDQPAHVVGMNDGGSEVADMVHTTVPNFLLGGGTMAGTTDMIGGTDAGIATLGNGTYVYENIDAATVGLPMWISFDLKQLGATPLAFCTLELGNGSSQIYWRRYMPVPVNWRRFGPYMFTPSLGALNALLVVNRTGIAGTVGIGRVRVRSGRAPFTNHFSKLASEGSAPPVPTLLGANVTSVTPAGTDMVGAISLVMAGALAANTRIARLTWANSYGATAPVVALINQTSGAGLAVVNFYSTPSTGASIDLFCNQALAAGTYAIVYFAVARGVN